MEYDRITEQAFWLETTRTAPERVAQIAAWWDGLPDATRTRYPYSLIGELLAAR